MTTLFPTQVTDQNIIDSITKHPNANDKIAFNRRLLNLEQWVDVAISPIEAQIVDLKTKLIPMYDKMYELRAEAREHCTHPPEQLYTIADGVVQCRFCTQTFHV